MERELTMAFIVVRLGPLRNSLQTLIATMPRIRAVAESRHVAAVLRLGAQLPPDLVVGDGIR